MSRDVASSGRVGSVPVVLAAVLALGSLAAGPGATAALPSESSAEETQTPAPTTVRFTRGRRYVVTTRSDGRVLRGRGVLPRGLSSGAVTARPARDVLGSGRPEVLLDLGTPSDGSPVRVHTLLTTRGGTLRPVTLGGNPLTLATYTEGGDDGGFRCRRGRLLTHWFHHGSGQGEQITYRLVGTRLREVSRRQLRRSVVGRPESCG